jgi:hypothetical protein
MKKLLATSLLAAAFALTTSTVFADEVVVEKKTTTSPFGTVVIENETSRTFKLQGHNEVYTAPAGTDLRTLSGKEVTVSVDPSGTATKVERRTTVTD